MTNDRIDCDQAEDADLQHLLASAIIAEAHTDQQTVNPSTIAAELSAITSAPGAAPTAHPETAVPARASQRFTAKRLPFASAAHPGIAPRAPDTVRVLIAEELHLIREGLVSLLQDEQGFSVAAVESGEKVAAAGRRHRPHLALIDSHLSDMDGFTATRLLLAEAPDCEVLIMSAQRRPGDLRRAVASGAIGFLTKDTPPADLVDAIHRVAHGERVLNPVAAYAELCSEPSPLTPRELDVLRAAAEGATVAEIAQVLFLSIGTVRNYLSRIHAKVGARTRVEAISIARQQGWLATRDGRGAR